MIGLRGLGSVVVVLAGAALASEAAADEATMVVSADQPGPQYPETGRSLFDELFATPSGYDIPFPFERMIEALNARLAPATVRTALIPLGRSLQRYAADPGYFESPRLVVAVDADAADSRLNVPRLKDRLFFGYQPAAEAIEVISYNEAAGRFEFQEITDYGAGQAPRVEYAARGICIICHQSHAPIFSRPLWCESYGNPEIAERLAGLGAQYHGAPVRQGVDSLDDIDQSTDRANRLSAISLLWDEGCGEGAAGIDCRAAVLNAALRYRLTGGSGEWTATGSEEQAARLQDRLSRLWPGGLAAASPDLPNRDPVEALQTAERPSAILDTDGAVDPETPRAPLRHWIPAADAQSTFTGLARDLGSLFAAADIAWLDDRLTARDTPVAKLDAPCLLQRIARDGRRMELRMACGGPDEALSLAGFLTVDGTEVEGGRIDRLSTDEGPGIGRLRVTGGTLTHDAVLDSIDIVLREDGAGMRARLLSGHRIAGFRLRSEDASHGRVEIEIADDLGPLDAAIDAIAHGDDGALAPGPPRRRAILASLEHAFAEQ
jgi:hypothetical protein